MILRSIFSRFESLIEVFAEPDQRLPPQVMTKFYGFYLRQVWRVLLLTGVTGLLSALIEIWLLSAMGQVVDMTKQGPALFWRRHGDTLLWMGAAILLLRPVFIILDRLMLNQAIAPSLGNRIRWQQHRRVMGQTLTFFQSDFSGRIANRIMQTGVALRDTIIQIVDALWFAVIYTVGALWMFADASPWLMLPLLGWLIGYTLIIYHFVPRTKERSWQVSQSRSKVIGRIVDGYSNILTLKLFGHARREEAYVAEAMDEQVTSLQRMTRLTTSMDLYLTSLNGVLLAGTGALALWLWLQGKISIGAIALSIALAMRINNMSAWIMGVVNSVFENIGTVQDGIDTVTRACDVVDRPQAPALTVKAGAISFEQVGFDYGQRKRVIEGLSLEIAPGEKVGLVGASGAGKSTLVNLLLRLYDLQAGAIRIDGQNIAEVTQESLHSHIGVVTQDTSLLHRSIRDNLLYGRPEASEAELLTAVRQAKADEFILQLVDGGGQCGYEAMVGERGVKLSGGQRQRIAIARVLLKNAPILVLDEATSALDSEAEAAIQENLDVLMEGKTVIAIAHRLSTIAHMDRLVVMEQGRIVEAGSHVELLARQGRYARLWQRQTGGFLGAAEA